MGLVGAENFANEIEYLEEPKHGGPSKSRYKNGDFSWFSARPKRRPHLQSPNNVTNSHVTITTKMLHLQKK